MTDVTWTFEDEAQLSALTERKEEWEANKRRKLERLLENVFYSGIGFDEVLEDMIKNADEYTEALNGFTSLNG